MNLNEIFEELKNEKLTENGDLAYKSTGNHLLDLFFFAPYFEKHLSEVKLGTSEKEKLFAMFMRDPRLGQGRRDYGRKLMKLADVNASDISLAGRNDDLLALGKYNEFYALLKSGDNLAKKWAPRLRSKNDVVARKLMTIENLTEQQYRKLIKLDSTVEYKLSHKQDADIDFSKVPSLAGLKYFRTFMRKQEERFKAFLDQVKKGEKEIKVATTSVYDIYKNRKNIEAQVFFDTYLKKYPLEISALPILDVSGSMGWCDRDSLRDKATAIAHFISKVSSYEKGKLLLFSNKPYLVELGKENNWFKPNFNESNYINEINSLAKFGEVADTDFGKVMQVLSKLSDYPDYLICLTDMEFNQGSRQSKDETMRIFKEHGAKTKIIWWNFNDRNKTAPETDKYGNIFMSGFNTKSLNQLELVLNGSQFLDKLLETYKEQIDK